MKKIYRILTLCLIFLMMHSFIVSSAGGIRGDVNGDGAKTSADAIFLLRHILVPSMYPIEQSADMNRDGAVTSADAIYLLRHTLVPHLYPLEECRHIETVILGKAPTCTETGLTEGQVCTVCGETLVKQEVISALGHTEKILPAKAPTCTETGLTEGQICTVCHVTLVGQTVIPATGHHYISSVIAPTCTEKGYTNHACVCGDAYKDTYTAALGHNYNTNYCNICKEKIQFTTSGLSYQRLDDGTYAVYAHSIASLPETVIIPPTYNGRAVTQIRYVAFRYASQIKTVMMPNTITKIDWEAFSRCTSLENVYLPEGLKSLEHYAFLECSSMESIKLPESLEEIDHNVFVDCSALKALYIPAKTASIGYNVFIGCDSLERYEIAAGNPNYKSIDGVLYNKTGTILRAYPLGRTNQNFTVPSGVTTIDSQAFSFAKYLESVTISDTVTTLKSGAFYGCPNLRSIHLGKNVSTIEHSGYTTLIGGCPKFTTFTVSNRNWDFSAVDGVLYNKSQSKLVIYPVGKSAAHYTFPSTVTRVGSFAFAYANNLESVFIPNTIKIYDGYAFYGCQKLKTIEWQEGCTQTGQGTVYECINLTTAKLPSTIQIVDSVTFNECESLTTVNIPHGVTKIESVAFGNCEKLETITIPSTVTFIGQYAFSHCSTLNMIHYEGTKAQWNAISKESDWIRYVNGQIHIVCTDGTITFSRWH